MSTANGIAIAGGALSVALTELFVAEGILEHGEFGIVIANAMTRLNALGHSTDVQNARNALSAIARVHGSRNGLTEN